MEIFLTTARTLYEAFRTVIWRCRVQRYFYLAELNDLNGRAYRRREPLTAGSLRVDEFFYMSLSFLGLGWESGLGLIQPPLQEEFRCLLLIVGSCRAEQDLVSPVPPGSLYPTCSG